MRRRRCVFEWIKVSFIYIKSFVFSTMQNFHFIFQPILILFNSFLIQNIYIV